jgi:2'-5' RNA ligase
VRCFVQLELPAEARDRCAQLLQEWKRPAGSLRLTVASKLHITLAFLDEVAESRIPEISDALASAAAGHPPLIVAAGGVGAFPDLRRPRVLWFGVPDDDGAIGALAESVHARLDAIGLPRENRPFRPHVTFARVRSGRLDSRFREILTASDGDQAAGGTVDRIQLMRSEVGPDGATHTVVASFPLSG